MLREEAYVGEGGTTWIHYFGVTPMRAGILLGLTAVTVRHLERPDLGQRSACCPDTRQQHVERDPFFAPELRGRLQNAQDSIEVSRRTLCKPLHVLHEYNICGGRDPFQIRHAVLERIPIDPEPTREIQGARRNCKKPPFGEYIPAIYAK
jgi:hypothetical protein